MGRAALGLGLGTAGAAVRWMRGVILSERRRVRQSFPQKPGPVAGLPPAPPIGAETFSQNCLGERNRSFLKGLQQDS